jgi:hypothetical protein
MACRGGGQPAGDRSASDDPESLVQMAGVLPAEAGAALRDWLVNQSDV